MELEKFFINEKGQLHIKEGPPSVLFHDGLFKNLGVNIKEVIIDNEGEPSIYIFHGITQELKVLFNRPNIGGILITECDGVSFEYNVDSIEVLEVRRKKEPLSFPGKINKINELDLKLNEDLRKIDFTNIKLIGQLDLNINIDAIKIDNDLKITYPINFNKSQGSLTDKEYERSEIINDLLNKYRGT